MINRFFAFPRSAFKFMLIAGTIASSSSSYGQVIDPIQIDPVNINPEDVLIAPVDPKDRAVRLAEPDPKQTQQVAEAVRDRLAAEFLTDDERSALRVLHGQWTEEDLDNPELAPRIALDAGDYSNEVFNLESTETLLKARSLIERGLAMEATAALDSIENPSLESMYLRGRALELLGNTDQAIEQYALIELQLAEQQLDNAHSLAIGSRALIRLTRLRTPAVSAKADYESIEQLIGYARDRVDRLDWRIRMVEANLLYEHHNLQDAHAAAIEALRLNPRAAAPMLLLGHIAVDGFDFDTAENLANTLDGLASSFDLPEADEEIQASAGGAIIRARIALRRKDSEGAEFALDPALAQYPSHPVLRALEASAAAAGYRMSSANRLLNKYDESFPGSSLGAVWVGKTLSEYRQYEYSAEILRRAIELSPNWGEPRLQLGLMLVQAGKDDAARLALTDAMKLDPFNVRAQNSLKLLEELATYETIETEHFIIRYKAGVDELLAREMPEVLERIHERVCSNLPGGMDHEPSEKTIIELMPNHEWFAVRIGGMPSIHTMAASTGPVIAFESPKIGPKSTAGAYDWERVLQHEYTHTVNLSRTKNRVIHWMTEANAVFNEDAPRDQSQWALLTNAYRTNALFDLEEINIAFVRPRKPTDRPLAYAQGAWMFEFLVERFGELSPREIMDASTTGRSAPEAFEMVLGITPDAFMEDFTKWAGKQLQSNGLLSPADVPDLNELLGDPAAGMPSKDDLDELLEEYPDHTDLLQLRLSLDLALEGDRLNPEQIRLLERAIDLRPTDEVPHKRLARHYLSSDSFEDQIRSIEHLEFLDVREVHTPVYAYQLALLYAQTGENELSLQKAIRATRVDPFNAQWREQAARMALLNSDYQQAEHQLRALIKIEPDRAVHQRRLDALLKIVDDSE